LAPLKFPYVTSYSYNFHLTKERFNNKTIDLPITSYLDLASTIVPFSLDMKISKGIEMDLPKEGIKVPHGILDLSWSG